MLYIANSPFSGKRGIKGRLKDEKSDFLRKRFKGYIFGNKYQSELQEAQKKMPNKNIAPNKIKIKQH